MTLADIGAYGWGSLHAKVVSGQTGIDMVDKTNKPIRYICGGGNNYDRIEEYFAGSSVRIIHWIGSDVTKAVNGECQVFRDAIHLVDGFNLVPELRKIGIEAQMATWKPKNCPDGPLPLGNKITVYMPPTRHDFFRYDLMKEVERQCGEQFLWLDAKEQDLESYDVKSVIAQSRMLIRAPEHDGLSHTAMEFLVAGRTVLNTQSLPYCERIEPEVNDILSKLKTEPIAEAPDFWLDFIEKHHIRKILENICAGV